MNQFYVALASVKYVYAKIPAVEFLTISALAKDNLKGDRSGREGDQRLPGERLPHEVVVGPQELHSSLDLRSNSGLDSPSLGMRCRRTSKFREAPANEQPLTRNASAFVS